MASTTEWGPCADIENQSLHFQLEDPPASRRVSPDIEMQSVQYKLSPSVGEEMEDRISGDDARGQSPGRRRRRSSMGGREPPIIRRSRIRRDSPPVGLPNISAWPRGMGIRRNRFGASEPNQTGPRDYKQKYPGDAPYKEIDPEARAWFVYNDESAIFDNDMLLESNDSLDILLIFAGLFSGVLTTFVAQTSQALAPDNSAISSSVLIELVALQRAQANGTSFDNVPAADTSFSPSRIDLWTNGLWFTSLALSLCTALFSVLAKQWLRQYASFVSGNTRTRAFTRQFRYDGLNKWRVPLTIGILPTILHISLFLFLAGLVVFLIPLSRTLAYVLAGITGFAVVTYFVTTSLPVFYAQCPYRTPLSAIMFPLYHRTLYIVRWLLIWLHNTAISLRTPRWWMHTIFRAAPPPPSSSNAIYLPPWRDLFAGKLDIASLKEAEQLVVGDKETIPAQAADALTWMASTTSDLSAKIVAAEARGMLPEDLGQDAMDWQWKTLLQHAWQYFDNDPWGGIDSQDLVVGRLIRSSLFYPKWEQNPALCPRVGIPLAPSVPIDTEDFNTVLTVCALGYECIFQAGDYRAEIWPWLVFDVILTSQAPRVRAPRWMWWSICTQAARGAASMSSGYSLAQTCSEGEINIERWNLRAWLRGMELPPGLRVGVRRVIEERRTLPRVMVEKDNSLYTRIPLHIFLADHFSDLTDIWESVSLDPGF